MRAAYYGADIEVTDHPSKAVVIHLPRGRERHFPYRIVRWKTGDTRHAVLVEPILKCETHGLFTEGWREDDEAMKLVVRRLVQSTLADTRRQLGVMPKGERA